MKNLKALEAPQVGMYQVLNAYNEIHNDKLTPVADVIFKAPNWSKFDIQIRRIRLRSFFYKSSIGPKDELTIKGLRFKYLKVSNKFERPHPEKVDKVQHGLEWDIIEPVNYNDKIREESELAMDFTLQEENLAINEQELYSVLDGIEADDYLSMEIESFNMPIQIVTSKEDL